MTNHFDGLAAITTAFTTYLGYKGSAVATFLATDAGVDLPGWVQWISGPVGALVVLAVGLWWMTKRLEASEKKADEREAKRDAIIEKLHADHADKVESLSHATMRVTDRVSNALDAVATELAKRPCGLELMKQKIKDEE